MTYRLIAATRLDTPVCWSADGDACPLGGHDRGFIDPFGVIHWRDRRFTRRGAKNFLTLVARRTRWLDPEYLNSPDLEWKHVYLDAVAAQKMAGRLGFRIPAHLFDYERMRCARLAAKRGVKLTKYPAVYSWTYSWLDRELRANRVLDD